MPFRGFPPEALSFFAGLEADNSKAYWTAHAATYESAVRAPMLALIDEAPEAWKPMRMFRPNRDVRFSADKSPYKTQAAAMGEREGGSVAYVALSANGLYAGVGFYAMSSDQLARYRAAVDDDDHGAELEGIVARLTRAGFEVSAHDSLKTVPRGFARDHPRADLLRRKGLAAMRDFGRPTWLHTAKARTKVIDGWSTPEPLSAWLERHVGPSTLPPDERRFG